MTQLFMTNCLTRTGDVAGRKSIRKIVSIQFKATVVLLCDSLITNNFRCNYAKNALSTYQLWKKYILTHNSRVRTHSVTKYTAFHRALQMTLVVEYAAGKICKNMQ